MRLAIVDWGSGFAPPPSCAFGFPANAATAPAAVVISNPRTVLPATQAIFDPRNLNKALNTEDAQPAVLWNEARLTISDCLIDNTSSLVSWLACLGSAS